MGITAQIDIPGFELISLLGQGGHGRVYKALCKSLNRVVALKIMADEDVPDRSKNFERIQNEAKILARLDHPNIVQVFQVGCTSQGKAFLVSEYLEGKTLDKLLEERGRLNDGEVTAIALQISDALTLLHDNGLVHRDIKPSNIMLLEAVGSKYFQVKLLDFGVTREFSTDGVSKTVTTALLGTPAYMSPEQCRGDKLDARSDLYSLACVCFQSVFGELPFSGESALTVQYKHLNDDVASIDVIRDNPKDDLSIFFCKALAKDSSARPRNASQFKSEFFSALKSHNRNAKSARDKQKPLLLVGSAAVFLVVGFAALSFVNHSKSEQQVTLSSLKPSKPVAGSNIRRASAESELASLAEKYKPRMYVFLPKAEHDADLTKILNRVNEVLPRIKKNQQGLRFTAHYLRALIVSDLKRPQEEQRASMLEALADCSDGKNGEYFQAVYCYLLLAKMEGQFKDFRKALAYVTKADKLLEMRKADVPIPIMDLPAPLSLILDPVWQSVPVVMAELEENNKNYAKAEKYYRKSADFGAVEYGSAGGAYGRRGIARVLVKQGKTKEARSMMIDLMQRIEKEPSKSAGVDMRQAHALSLIGQWFYDMGDKDTALKCLAIVKEKQKKHKLLDPYSSKAISDAYEELKSTNRVALWDLGTNIISNH